MKDWDFPPHVFWLSPVGRTIESVGHLTAIQEQRDTFGLPALGMDFSDPGLKRLSADSAVADFVAQNFSLALRSVLHSRNRQIWQ